MQRQTGESTPKLCVVHEQRGEEGSQTQEQSSGLSVVGKGERDGRVTIHTRQEVQKTLLERRHPLACAALASGWLARTRAKQDLFGGFSGRQRRLKGAGFGACRRENGGEGRCKRTRLT